MSEIEDCAQSLVEKCEHEYILSDKYRKPKKIKGSAAVENWIIGIYVCRKCLNKKHMTLKRN